MPKVDLRRHQRILVPTGHAMRVHSNDAPGCFDGHVTVIGLGGMFIRAGEPQSPGTVLKLTLEDSIVTFEFECTVRHAAENGVGVEITGITPENERRLRTLLVGLKG